MGQVHIAPVERLRVRVCWHFGAEVSRPVEGALGQDASSHGRYNVMRVADTVVVLMLKGTRIRGRQMVDILAAYDGTGALCVR